MNNNTAKGPVTVLGIDVANLPVCLIGLEACGGAHHWVRLL